MDGEVHFHGSSRGLVNICEREEPLSSETRVGGTCGEKQGWDHGADRVVRKSRDGSMESSGLSERPEDNTRQAPWAEPGTVPRPSQACLTPSWQQPQKAGNIISNCQSPAREGAYWRKVRSQWWHQDWSPDSHTPKAVLPTPVRPQNMRGYSPGWSLVFLTHPLDPPIPVSVSLARSRACPSASSCSRRASSWASCRCTSNRLLSRASFSKLQHTQSLRP